MEVSPIKFSFNGHTHLGVYRRWRRPEIGSNYIKTTVWVLSDTQTNSSGSSLRLATTLLLSLRGQQLGEIRPGDTEIERGSRTAVNLGDERVPDQRYLRVQPVRILEGLVQGRCLGPRKMSCGRHGFHRKVFPNRRTQRELGGQLGRSHSC